MYIKLPINVEKPVATRQLVFIFMTALSLNLISRTTSFLTGYFHSCNTDLKREHSGSVVDCGGGGMGWRLTGITVLCP